VISCRQETPPANIVAITIPPSNASSLQDHSFCPVSPYYFFPSGIIPAFATLADTSRSRRLCPAYLPWIPSATSRASCAIQGEYSLLSYTLTVHMWQPQHAHSHHCALLVPRVLSKFHTHRPVDTTQGLSQDILSAASLPLSDSSQWFRKLSRSFHGSSHSRLEPEPLGVAPSQPPACSSTRRSSAAAEPLDSGSRAESQLLTAHLLRRASARHRLLPAAARPPLRRRLQTHGSAQHQS
jgi:hypothetical protein